MEEVISVFKSRTVKLHTTRSWDFMALPLVPYRHRRRDHQVPDPLFHLTHGDDVIIGILDSGIWPESESFKEEPGTGRIPSCWKGKCVQGENFKPSTACNQKLIGARYYLQGFEAEYGPLSQTGNPEYKSPRDYLGHGTHVASIAVGSVVRNASFFGLGQGTARGGAPRARLAVYKMCWGLNNGSRCSEADILAAFDDALHDGVHVISASFGYPPPLTRFLESSADIGAFHAMQLGVSVVFSAGNSGPHPGRVENVAPWSISVAASTIDRNFPTRIIVNETFSIMGESFITNKITGTKLADASKYFFDGSCRTESLKDPDISIEGKVVICFSSRGKVEDGDAQEALYDIRASVLVYVDDPTKQYADLDIIPTVRLDMDQGTRLRNYLSRFIKLPMVRIEPSRTLIGKLPAPEVAYFSSRGPSSLAPDFLKPDITAPGVNILGAWPSKTPPTFFPGDRRSVNWNFLSGTSMACPHVSGVVALLRSRYPTWSPAAIRSALITTADSKDRSDERILADGSMKVSDPFDVGAGHLNPMKAMDPGLIYDMKASDYIQLLCNIGYNKTQIAKMIILPGTNVKCGRKHEEQMMNLNYPSITVFNLQSAATIKRTARNVGRNRYAVYFLSSVVEPKGVEVMVWPRVLIFSPLTAEICYYVTLTPVKESGRRYEFGEIVWSDGLHGVRSPLVVFLGDAINVHHHQLFSAF